MDERLDAGKMTKEKDKDAPKREAIRAQIDENLKRVYADALEEGLPERFRDLLAQLQEKDRAGRDDAQ